MLEQAIGPYEDFLLDTCEIDRGGVSYSIDTVAFLMEKYHITEKMGFVLGDDLIASFHEWKDARRLADKVDLIVAHRKYEKRRAFRYPHTYIDNTALPISSSDIRRRIREGRSARFFLPESVWRYIQDNHIYSVAARIEDRGSVDLQEREAE
jgi:nicotinate-nucleotide adenylyltransferase